MQSETVFTPRNKFFLSLAIAFALFIDFAFLGAGRPSLSEGWFSDIAYNLNWDFNGKMASDIPYGSSWSTGIGKLFFLIHHFFYGIFGVGVFQARAVTFLAGLLLLAALFDWTRKRVSPEIALLTVALLVFLPSFTTFAVEARQDVWHSFFSFLSFYCISLAVIENKKPYFILAGFVSALSVDISFRGIEIVFATYLFNLLFISKENFIRRNLLMLAGSLAAFAIWFSLNVLHSGWDNFVQYQLVAASTDGGPYSLETLFSEVQRFATYFLTWNAGRVELVFVLPLLFCFVRFRSEYGDATKHPIAWLLVTFAVMSIIERNTEPLYLLLYTPFLYLLCAIGLFELLKRQRKVGMILFLGIVILGTGLQANKLRAYVKKTYILNTPTLSDYYARIGTPIDMTKNIIGTTTHWYAFPDSQYYGGQFYLSRLMSPNGELKPANDYQSKDESAKALLEVFRKRAIEYVVACEYFKPTITPYFPEGKLPERNFKLLSTVEDGYFGCAAGSVPPCKTEIYQVVSYDP